MAAGRSFGAVGLVLLGITSGCGVSVPIRFEQGEPGRSDTKVFTEDVRSSSNTHSQLGVKRMKLEQWEEAKPELEQAIREDEKDHRSMFALGVTHEKLGDMPNAMKYYDKAYIKSVDNEQYAAAYRRVHGLKSVQTASD